VWNEKAYTSFASKLEHGCGVLSTCHAGEYFTPQLASTSHIVDDFSGWSSDTKDQIADTRSSSGTTENIHGPYGNPSDPTTVFKAFSLPAHTSLTVKARYYSVGSWDVEADPNLKVTLTLTLTLTPSRPITPCDPHT
jgi:hypothetical protein